MAWIFPLVVLLFIGLFDIFSSYNEAKIYNKMCNPKIRATTMDAMFADLRVDGNCAKSN